MNIREWLNPFYEIVSNRPILIGSTLLACWIFRWALSKTEKPGQKNFLRQYTTVRRLDPSEDIFAFVEDFQTISQTFSTIVRGPLTPEVLRQALCMMQVKHQVLRFGIHKTDGVLYFHEFDKPQDHIDIMVHSRRDDLHWQEMAINCNDSFRSFIEDQGLLWKIKFLHNTANPNGPHEIILQCVHTVIDGSSRAIFIKDLLEFCGQILDGTPTNQIIELKYHPGLGLLLFENSNNRNVLGFIRRILPYPLQVIRVTLDFIIKGTPKSLYPRNVVPYYERSTAFIPFKLSKEVTQNFYKACKEHGVTFNSGFLAIVSWATQNTWHIKPKQNIEIVLPIRMRHVARPQVSMEHITFMISSMNLKIPTVESSLEIEKIWEYAKIVEARVHGGEGSLMKKAIKEKFDVQFLTPLIPILSNRILAGDGRFEHFIISNLGRMEVPLQYGKHLELQGWYNLDKQVTRGCDMAHFMATFQEECCVTTMWTHPLVEQQKVEAYTNRVVEGIKAVSGLDTIEVLPYVQKKF